MSFILNRFSIQSPVILVIYSEVTAPEIPLIVHVQPSHPISTSSHVMLEITALIGNKTITQRSPAQIGAIVAIQYGFIIFHLRQSNLNARFITLPVEWVHLRIIDRIRLYREIRALQLSTTSTFEGQENDSMITLSMSPSNHPYHLPTPASSSEITLYYHTINILTTTQQTILEPSGQVQGESVGILGNI